MLMPSIFGENLFNDDWMDFSFPDVDKVLYGKHAKNVMKTDVKETDNSYEVDIDLPGFKKDEKKLKKAFFYVYYKNKRVSKLLLPDLKKGETYEFCVNIHSKMTRKDRQELLFKIRRGKTYISYRIAQPHNKKGY